MRPRYSAPRASSYLLVCVDPGARQAAKRCGVSLWLVAPAIPEGRLLRAAHVPAAEVQAWVREHGASARGVLPQAWLVEAPHIRGDQHAQRSGVNALRRVLAQLRRGRPRGSTWRGVRPQRWKGNVPKDAHHRRVLRVLYDVELRQAFALDPDGHTYQPDTADAIALGAWGLGRTGRGGVR